MCKTGRLESGLQVHPSVPAGADGPEQEPGGSVPGHLLLGLTVRAAPEKCSRGNRQDEGTLPSPASTSPRAAFKGIAPGDRSAVTASPGSPGTGTQPCQPQLGNPGSAVVLLKQAGRSPCSLL